VLPEAPGCYGLGFLLPDNRIISIGSLGECRLDRGRYIYFGSAMGPGGLRARIRHHVLPKNKLHWHIDYLLNENTLSFVWYLLGRESMECGWSQGIGQIEKIGYPITGFGSSDCRSGCTAHLLKIPEGFPNKVIGDMLKSVSGNSDLTYIEGDLLANHVI